MFAKRGDSAPESGSMFWSHPAASCCWRVEGEMSYAKQGTGGNGDCAAGAPPIAIADRIVAVKLRFPGKPEGQFFQKTS